MNALQISFFIQIFIFCINDIKRKRKPIRMIDHKLINKERNLRLYYRYIIPHLLTKKLQRLINRIRAWNFCRLAIEIESEYSNCFSRNLWRRNKRTTILFLINNYWIYSNNQCWWRVMIHQRLFVEWNCQIDTSNCFFSFYLWDFLHIIFFLF